jgi:hypothetical protein
MNAVSPHAAFSTASLSWLVQSVPSEVLNKALDFRVVFFHKNAEALNLRFVSLIRFEPRIGQWAAQRVC